MEKIQNFGSTSACLFNKYCVQSSVFVVYSEIKDTNNNNLCFNNSLSVCC